jgi:hypothetical protein
MKTMAEQYPTPERWESGNNHEETKRLREEKRQKELAEEPEPVNKHLEFTNNLLRDFCAINLMGRK